MKKLALDNNNKKQILREIIETSYEILLTQLSNGRIKVDNEAALQLQFSYLLKVIGELYQFSPNDLFSINLEVPFTSPVILAKSKSTKAKVDIVLILEDRLQQKDIVKCAIELKFFKKENQREPNNRYDAFNDIHNLEEYVNSKQYDFGVFILGTDHPHYVTKSTYSKDTSDFDLRDGKTYRAGTVLKYNTFKPYGENLELRQNYNFEWDEISTKWFLKLLI